MGRLPTISCVGQRSVVPSFPTVTIIIIIINTVLLLLLWHNGMRKRGVLIYSIIIINIIIIIVTVGKEGATGRCPTQLMVGNLPIGKRNIPYSSVGKGTVPRLSRIATDGGSNQTQAHSPSQKESTKVATLHLVGSERDDLPE